MPKITFTTKMDSELLEQMKKIAVKEKCSVSDILEKLMISYIKKVEKTEGNQSSQKAKGK
ncbi:hypothetical protein D7X25_26680 [bacterium 1XD42-8]|jgi:uncharacterized OsmC-like protein|nr:hypothetical protein [Lachnospiraceae bacterium]RKJ42762.1 hypothetical protein D7X25_26680 [bacterium 1XD42-8]